MKVGIISLFDNENFGNRLQNYAMQQILSEYCEEVITIKNKPKFKNLKQKLMRSSFLAESVFMNKLMGKNRKSQFLKFNNKYLKFSSKCYCYSNDDISISVKDQCDFYCAGSDQIWNPNLGRKNFFNYLGFAESKKTFSYAASFGIDLIPEQFHENLKKGLNHVKYLSVREESGKNIIRQLTGRDDAEVHIDPTLLLKRDEWDKIIKKPKNFKNEKYVLLYFLGNIPAERKKKIIKSAEEKQCKVINILDSNGLFYNIGPSEFIYLIKNAEFVCTDSFHASVFSFLYGTRLVIFNRADKNANMSSRIENFIKTFCLERNFAYDDNFPLNWDTCDYSSGYEVLNAERVKAKKYFDMVLLSE